MAPQFLISIFSGIALLAALLLPIAYVTKLKNTYSNIMLDRHTIFSACVGAAILHIVKWAIFKSFKNTKKSSMYNLQHGRLHLRVPTPMWMNMGYWKPDTPQTMAEASRDLLKAILSAAKFSQEADRAEIKNNTRRSKCLIDVGFGCGDQTLYLMSDAPISRCDEEWWDEREYCVKFDKYIGITMDEMQARYALERIEELRNYTKKVNQNTSDREDEQDITLFCADAANPNLWTQELGKAIQSAKDGLQDCWLLALDTAYHFSPSRWPLIKYANSHFDASFMAFDLYLSSSATWRQKLVLRLLTTLMGAPWANFSTIEEYRKTLVKCGYSEEMISLTDISEHVFGPLSTFVEMQDERLKMFGLSVGSFNVARMMFSWWARSGVVRGVIVVARKRV